MDSTGPKCRRRFRWRRPKQSRLEQIKELFEKSRQTYGHRSICRELAKTGKHCEKKRVLLLMKQADLKPKTKRKYSMMSDSKHPLPVAENHLNCEFTSAQMNDCWDTSVSESFFATLKKESVSHYAFKTRGEA